MGGLHVHPRKTLQAKGVLALKYLRGVEDVVELAETNGALQIGGIDVVVRRFVGVTEVVRVRLHDKGRWCGTAKSMGIFKIHDDVASLKKYKNRLVL